MQKVFLRCICMFRIEKHHCCFKFILRNFLFVLQIDMNEQQFTRISDEPSCFPSDDESTNESPSQMIPLLSQTSQDSINM